MTQHIRVDQLGNATDTARQAATLIGQAFAAPGGPAGAPGQARMADARILLDLAAVQAAAQQAEALTRIANVQRNQWDASR